jgi:hypothetical protein
LVQDDQITKIIAYEKDEERAIQAENSEVAKKFEGKIKIVNSEFPESLDEELAGFGDIQKLVFFDGEEWFCDKKTSKTRTEFENLLKSDVLGHNDIYLITSCIAERAWHTIEDQQLEYYKYYYANKAGNISLENQEKIKNMLIDNVVDLNVELAIRNCNASSEKAWEKGRISAIRLGKIKYNDYRHGNMALLGFRFTKTSVAPKALEIPFDYEKQYISNKRIENIFDSVRNL